MSSRSKSSQSKTTPFSMELKTLKNTLPWDWPKDAGRYLLGILTDKKRRQADRLRAAELSGQFVALNDATVGALLDILVNPGEPEDLRCQAATSLGSALEHAQKEGGDIERIVLPTQLFKSITTTFQEIYQQTEISDALRRGILEASSMEPMEWHVQAIRDAYARAEPSWKKAAVYCIIKRISFDEPQEVT